MFLFPFRRLGQGRFDLPVEGEGPSPGGSQASATQVHSGAVQKRLL